MMSKERTVKWADEQVEPGVSSAAPPVRGSHAPQTLRTHGASSGHGSSAPQTLQAHGASRASADLSNARSMSTSPDWWSVSPSPLRSCANDTSPSPSPQRPAAAGATSQRPPAAVATSQRPPAAGATSQQPPATGVTSRQPPAAGATSPALVLTPGPGAWATSEPANDRALPRARERNRARTMAWQDVEWSEDSDDGRTGATPAPPEEYWHQHWDPYHQRMHGRGIRVGPPGGGSDTKPGLHTRRNKAETARKDRRSVERDAEDRRDQAGKDG